MPRPVPLLVYSDGPRLPTGLARIARDLCARIHADQEALGFHLLQVGYDPMPGPAPPWPVWSIGHMEMGDEGDWGARALPSAWLYQFGKTPGVLLSIWDPARAYSLLAYAERMPVEQLWGYFPLDGWNVNQTIGGPAREALQRYDRVLAYGRWGSELLQTVRQQAIPYLPHGLDLDVWTYQQTPHTLGRAEEILQQREGEIVIGCVATNQPRKDFPLYFATLAELKRRGHKVRGWIHTDKAVRAWAVPQLASDFGLGKRITLSLTLEDWELAACYSCCAATIAPGSGEGFGYPIVESLACGTPVVHVNYAGGTELVPLNAWQVPVENYRVEGIYNVQRPLVNPVDCANAVERALDWKRNDERTCQAYCRGSVEHLSWPRIWPRWRTWLKQGREGL